METECGDISSNLQLEGTSIDRSICIEDISSTSEILQLESRPILPSSGRFPTNVESGISLRIPSLLSDYKGPKTSAVATSKKDDTYNSSMANSTLVPTGFGHGNPKTNTAPNIAPSTVGPIGRNSSITSRLLSKPSGLASVRDRLRDSGVSEEASSLFVLPEGEARLRLMNQPGRSGVCGVVDEVWIPLHVL